jgi:hypothetical protein
VDEQHWETESDPVRMLRAWRAALSDSGEQWYFITAPERKLYLFTAAVCRSLHWLFRHDWHRLAVDFIEETADEESHESLSRDSVWHLHAEAGHPSHPDNPALDAAVRAALHPSIREGSEQVCVHVSAALKSAWGNRTPPAPGLADLLRDIIGNPFRAVTFSPDWRTSTAVQLARQMYDSRDFAPMPILADALQDAGCEQADVLAHCRDPGAVHVRGCWVVDLVLGKS